MRAGPVGGGLGLVVIVLLAMFFGVDPRTLLDAVNNGAAVSVDQRGGGEESAPPTDELGQFVSVVLADTEDTWSNLFQRMGRTYEEPRLVLFRDAVSSACGYAQSAVGPFYCPNDHRVYIDLGFYRDLKERFGAPGDFAQAYVIAHEVGHHVQTLLGITDRVAAAQRGGDRGGANGLSVRTELQADCLAGVWAHHAGRERDLLEQGDVEEGLNAASAIGDDRLQEETQGRVVPESFTHGSSEQRVRWFSRGVRAGDIDACDTFNTAEL